VFLLLLIMGEGVVRAGIEVPFTDLGAMARQVWPEIADQFLAAVAQGRYIGGPPVAEFEAAWAAYCGTGHAVGVANGTDALQLTLQALGIGAGHEVIVPANTFIATAAAVARAGATPVFVDVDPDTLLLTPDLVAAAIGPATRAVMAVSLYGNMPDLPALAGLCARAGIHLIEDAAQAHGAAWHGRRAGSFGTAGCFSFYPGKNLGAFGDAGAVTTNDPVLAGTIRALANHGRAGGHHYQHTHIGTNSRLDTLHAIALTGKLAHTEAWTDTRITLADRYRKNLAGTPDLRIPEVAGPARHVYHLMVVQVPDRDRIQTHLATHGIATGVHYPIPCHQQPALRHYPHPPLPVTEHAATHLLSLPLYPHMTTDQVDHVCHTLDTALTHGAHR
jgi:dTDP-4-amino-4,6-dideoxygalactose transaminase